MDIDIHIDDNALSQFNISLPDYPIEENNVLRIDSNNWNLTDFTVTDV